MIDAKRDALGTTKIRMKVGPACESVEFVVLDPSFHFLLGRPWLHEAKAVASNPNIPKVRKSITQVWVVESGSSKHSWLQVWSCRSSKTGHRSRWGRTQARRPGHGRLSPSSSKAFYVTLFADLQSLLSNSRWANQKRWRGWIHWSLTACCKAMLLSKRPIKARARPNFISQAHISKSDR